MNVKPILNKFLPLLVAFAAGIVLGVGLTSFLVDALVSSASGKGGVPYSDSDAVGTAASTGGADASSRVDALVSSASGKEGVPSSDSDAVGTTASTEGVDVQVDASAVEPEIGAAHAARRARRAAAWERKERDREDFLTALNDELLSADQRGRHALFLEALKTRQAVRAEMATLRMAGQEVAPDVQLRLRDAESVLRTEREAEGRALREAAARAAGLDEVAVRQLMDDLGSIEAILGP